MKKLIGIRISALTETQLAELTSKLGMTQTEVVSHAVENYYQKMEDKMSKKIETISEYFDQHPNTLYICESGDYVTDGKAAAKLYRDNPDMYNQWGDHPSTTTTPYTGWYYEQGNGDIWMDGNLAYRRLWQCRISVDNGRTFCIPAEAFAHIEWDVITEMMDDVVREYTHGMVGDTLPEGDNLAFLTEYLKHAPADLVIG